ncbi:hypothetical protein P4O66_000025 [Electrophorus voltai]|uniref:Uncharacterized protein n=1 Tax=Electrophorus voltai TaxID=2609070 RepID=A0AAD8ZW89_9TELE|nr:hypothetical protein P4O66_000025 [Electrophorus voltai]
MRCSCDPGVCRWRSQPTLPVHRRPERMISEACQRCAAQADASIVSTRASELSVRRLVLSVSHVCSQHYHTGLAGLGGRERGRDREGRREGGREREGRE